MYNREPPRNPAKKWKEGDTVSPSIFAKQGYWVKAHVSQVIPITPTFHPCSGYVYHSQVYIISWSSPGEFGGYTYGEGVYFGNELLSWEDAVESALYHLKEKLQEKTSKEVTAIRELETDQRSLQAKKNEREKV